MKGLPDEDKNLAEVIYNLCYKYHRDHVVEFFRHPHMKSVFEVAAIFMQHEDIKSKEYNGNKVNRKSIPNRKPS